MSKSAIYSMTGFASQEFQNESIQITMELKSYNNRYLDFNINMPSYLASIEEQIKDILKKEIKRGRIELSIRLRDQSEGGEFNIDHNLSEDLYNGLSQVKERLGIDEDLTLDHLLSFDGWYNFDRSRDAQKYWSHLEPMLKECVKNYQQRRRKEGEHTKEDLLSLLSRLEGDKESIAVKANDIERSLKDNIKARFDEVSSSSEQEPRMMAELAVLLVKYSIHEEISRLESHFSSFRNIISQGGAVGKKLDFLAQEIHREINTIGSKNILGSISTEVVNMKDVLENIREQLRNIE